MDFLYSIKRHFIDFIKKTNIVKKINHNEFIFYFLFNLKSKFGKFKINIDTKCLVLSQYPGAEIKGLGGLISQYPKNFEILSMTNGSSLIEELNPVEVSSIKKEQFNQAMKMARVKGYKVFDIDQKTLKNHYDTFKKIDISEIDYIFLPNVYDNNIDTIALLSHFKQILKDKEHKPDMKIIMYESDFPLCSIDYFVDISSIIGMKKKLLEIFYPSEKHSNYVDKVIGLNAFRAISMGDEYEEAFMAFSVDEFRKIPLI